MKKIIFFFFLIFCLANPCIAGFISEEEEIKIGKEGSRKLEARYGLCNDTKELERINRIGQNIVAVTERSHLKYYFKILNVNKVNALAFPGGFIYVTKGLLPHVDEEELAFVLGHEIAHVAKRHSVKQMEQQLITKLGLITIVALINKGEINEGSMNTIQLANLVISSQYSRKDEMEADLASCEYMVYGLKYNPRKAISFLKKLKDLSEGELPGFLNSLVGSHPLQEERIIAIEEQCTRLGY